MVSGLHQSKLKSKKTVKKLFGEVKIQKKTNPQFLKEGLLGMLTTIF